MVSNYFAIVGAQRCGTTWLHTMLDQHPQIEMAKPVWPEPKHFIDEVAIQEGREEYIKKYLKVLFQRHIFKYGPKNPLNLL